ncbi:MAG: hypothetical protein OIF51_15945 [Cellvibrionaceae bacterium]|nr:hypothetical protein [Cellvibrionaceae bacterium]
MEVRIHSKQDILRSFIRLLPLALVAVVFYGMIFAFAAMYLLSGVFGVEETLARQAGWIIGVGLALFSAYFYLDWLTRSLSAYRLSIIDETLSVRGMDGWKSLNIAVAVGTIREINVGQSANEVGKLSSAHGAVRDQIASRLIFIPVSGKPFKLDFATKAFESQSLYNFLIFAQSKGVQTNVCV